MLCRADNLLAQVFSVAKNRVKRLPTWFAQMTHLKVLKVDHNPLEWPPKEVVTFPLMSANANGTEGEVQRKIGSKIEEAEEMQKWLPNLLGFIRDNAEQENQHRDTKSSREIQGTLAFCPSQCTLTEMSFMQMPDGNHRSA